MEIAVTSDMEAFIRPFLIAFGMHATPARVEFWTRPIAGGRAHVAYENGRVVGAAGAFAHTLTVPGGTVPAAAITLVAVLPSHRRRGILRRLQETQLVDAYRRGEPIAYLWATEGSIYGRFGYGMASQTLHVRIPSDNRRLRGSSPESRTVEIIDENNAYERIAPIYSRVCKQHPGMFARSEEWWRTRCLCNPELFYAVWDNSAYALYLIKMDSSSPSGNLEVVEAFADSVTGHREIWSYLLNIDLMTTVSASYLPLDHPLTLMLEDSQKMSVQVRNGLWIRIVDIKAALNARVLGSGSIVIQVIDSLLPHNEGTWNVAADGVSKTEASPDLIVDIADLSSVYLAGFSFSDLARSGRLHERVPGSIHRADQMFSWSCKPWSPQAF